MKNLRRDATLDLFLGQEVYVQFADGTLKKGKLEYKGGIECEQDTFEFAYHYHIGNCYFRKARAKKIRRVGEVKWTLRGR